MPRESYVFTASGHDTVLHAFRDIAKAAAQSEAAVQKTFANMPKMAARSARRTAAAQQTVRQRQPGRADDKELRELERRLQRELKAEQRAEHKRTQQAQRAESTRTRLQEREQQKADRQRQQWETRRYRRMQREQKAYTRSQERERTKAQRVAQRAAVKKQRERYEGRRRAVSAIGGGALGAIGAAGAAAAGIGGLLVGESMRLQTGATRLAVKGGQGYDPTTLRKSFERTAMQVRGSKAEDVMAGAERFVTKTGRLDKALEFSQLMAEMSLATGTATEEIGGAMADLFEKFDVKTVADMSSAMATLAVQGKRGAFELEDAASQFPKMAAAASRYGLKGATGVATLGALSQIARQATPSGEEAATSVESMFRQVIAKSGAIKKVAGVDVFRDKGKTQTNPIEDVITGTIAGAKGNLVKLQKIFDVRGIRAVSPLISTFNQTREATTGTEAQKTAAGLAAMREQLARATDAAGAEAEIQRDLAAMQQTAGAQLTAAWESLRASAGDRLMPVVAELAGKFAGFVETTDFSAVETAFVAVAEAAALAADALGILGKRTVSPEEQMARTQSQLARVEGQLAPLQGRALGAGKALLPAEQARLEQLTAQREQLSGQLTGQQDQAFKEVVKFRSPDDFAKKFAGSADLPGIGAYLAAGTLNTTPAQLEAARAERIASDIMANPQQREFGPMSEQQKMLLEEYRGQVTAQKTGGEVTLKTESAEASLDRVAAAAEKAAGALQRLEPRGNAFHE